MILPSKITQKGQVLVFTVFADSPTQALIVKTIQDEITAGYRFQEQHGLFRQQVES